MSQPSWGVLIAEGFVVSIYSHINDLNYITDSMNSDEKIVTLFHLEIIKLNNAIFVVFNT